MVSPDFTLFIVTDIRKEVKSRLRVIVSSDGARIKIIRRGEFCLV